MAEREDGTPAVGFTFTETMRGYIAPGDQEYVAAEKLGKKLSDKLKFKVTITMDDLDGFLNDTNHTAAMTGTIEAQRFGGTVPLDTGSFNLFMEDAGGRKQMRYAMTFRDKNGDHFRLDGFKDVHDDPGFDLWSDTTTLFIRIARADGADEPIVATGILHIRPIDFVPQVRSMKAINAKNPAESAAALAKFGRFFFDRLWDEYGISLKPFRRKAEKQPAAPEH